MGLKTIWGMIDARRIVFPVRSPSLNTLALFYRVPAAGVRPFVPGDAFAVDEKLDGTTDVLVAFHEYTCGDWGAVNLVDICLVVRPVGAPPDSLPGYLNVETPVDDPFNNEASYWSLGIRRRLGVVAAEYTASEVAFSVTEGGVGALRATAPRAPMPGEAALVAVRTYSYLDGVPCVIESEILFPPPELDPDAVRVELGEGPLADTWRALGLPLRPQTAAWGENLFMEFQAARPLDARDGLRADDSEAEGDGEAAEDDVADAADG